MSALIHAATMVTAGVYLIARTHVLYSARARGTIRSCAGGAATLLIAAFSALPNGISNAYWRTPP